jgi:NAD(P)-dependent dehydrogenase (short-subunit alcohol dehydrogenase family)
MAAGPSTDPKLGGHQEATTGLTVLTQGDRHVKPTVLSDRSGKWRRGLSAKTAVVTGGASGIGRAVAERLRGDGFRVGVIDLTPTDDGFGHVADVTDRAQVETAISAVRDKLGPILVLVNAAGVEGFKKFLNMSFQEWSKVIDVNLNGVFHTIQAVLPDMVEAGWGRIVNISSSSTHSGQPFMAHYVAAKSAVNGLTKSLALEYGPSGITVNAVPPGFVDTPMLRSAENRHLLGGTVEDHINRTPVRRVGKPEDIAAACAFFVSEEAGYITGQILGVNGGRNT